jgi:Zn-dependent peptidase ImmA (M78 family)
MPTATANDAAKAADWVLAKFWQRGQPNLPLPVDPVQIAKALGIDVYQVRLDQDVYAALVKEAGQDPTILLNQIDSKNRKRLSCAHEIGHFMRHSEDEYEYVDRRDVLSSDGLSAEEVYANTFAAALLMPEPEVRRLAGGGTPDYEMAARFDVSSEAMGYRLKNLSLG